MKKLFALLSVFFFFSLFSSIFSTPVQAANDCSWSVNPDGLITFCVGGFSTEAELRTATAYYWCSGDITCIRPAQSTPLYSGSSRGIGNDGNGYFACQTGAITSEVIDKINARASQLNIACQIGRFAPGSGGALRAQLQSTSGEDNPEACAQLAEEVRLTINGSSKINGTGADICSASATVTAETVETFNENFGVYKFSLCEQIKDSATKEKCLSCAGGSQGVAQGIWTAVGCIKTDAKSVVQSIMQIGLGVAGGVTLLMILGAGFMFSTSQGDPKRTSEAKEMLSAAVIGLLFIIFSVTILQFIGVSLLQIPGFADV